ncbi:uncharacterized protein DDB_G0288805 [Anopheles cruzii]|uniref:uncharacterized protein DDB_G0288805 n=1 Tax=Anopheles cruzii TaxID=68878 RepID=UPI0022EC8968|nr:uncharacterized protein DDB_G0288805 [Anopheles cruzii]
MLQSSLGQAQRFKKRERTQNWAYEEKHFLLELCRKDMHIIENKRLDSALTTLKNRAWKIIHQQFAIAFGTDRNCNRLKEQWRRMKACTRAEMLDYQQRIQRFGQDVADRKKPSQFTFEIWEFMQEAKKVCKNELMDDVDYSKIKLSLEENLPQGVSLKDCSDENDDESSSMWEKTSQNICEVQIKEDSQDELEDYEKGSSAKYPRLRGFSNASTPFGPVTSAVEATAHSRFNELLASSFASRLASEHHLNNNNNSGNSGGHCNNNNNNNSTGSGNKLLVDAGLDLYNRTAFGSESSLVDLGTSGPANLSQLDLSNTLEALNLLKTRFNRISQLGQWKNAFQEAQNLSTSSNNNIPPPSDSPTGSGHNHHAVAAGSGPELVNGGLPMRGVSPPIPPTTAAGAAARSLSRCIEVEQQQHQQSEHDLRMEILRTDLATAKINKETAELNRQLVLQKLRRVHTTGIGSRGGAPAEEDGVDGGEDGGSSTNNISNPSTADCRLVRSPTSLASVSVVPSPSPPLALRVVKSEEH